MLDAEIVDVRGAVVALGDLAIVASGSEVEVALGARKILACEGIDARVVSLASFELYLERPQAERDTVLRLELPRLAVEAASPFGWSAFAPVVVGVTTFGRSGKGPDVSRFFGITPEAVAAAAGELLAQ